MTRVVPLALIAGLLLAACGDAPDRAGEDGAMKRAMVVLHESLPGVGWRTKRTRIHKDDEEAVAGLQFPPSVRDRLIEGFEDRLTLAAHRQEGEALHMMSGSIIRFRSPELATLCTRALHAGFTGREAAPDGLVFTRHAERSGAGKGGRLPGFSVDTEYGRKDGEGNKVRVHVHTFVEGPYVASVMIDPDLGLTRDEMDAIVQRMHDALVRDE